ncbi:arsenic transporter [Mesorhizobium sp.]|uniref:arsenic transporter n=1 Tax=Mesorhizobium sp. TaxID=1871066 RepID=UPI003BAD11C1
MSPNLAIWAVTGTATAGVILRPFGWPEWIWAVAGAAILVAARLIAPADALAGIARGLDVYLFLIGMMLLSEVARVEGLFDWLAAQAARRAKGSAARLFLLVYVVGTIVTVFLSNDATAVVLTPAVAAAVRAAKVKNPLPYLLICAFIANAASFVLPISNPANLVIYGRSIPSLLEWLPRYILPSLVSVIATYAMLFWSQRQALVQEVAIDVPVPTLSAAGVLAAAGIVVTAFVLIGASAFDLQLGLPTALAGLATTMIVLIKEKKGPWSVAKDISWGVLPLVAGLFVLVGALERTGVIATVASLLREMAHQSPTSAAWVAGIVTGFGSNLANNLPMGLVAGTVVAAAHVPDHVVQAVLIGVDIGPNLSVTGSLATILWLTALRREGYMVGTIAFLRVGLVVMPPALLLALAAAFVAG